CSVFRGRSRVEMARALCRLTRGGSRSGAMANENDPISEESSRPVGIERTGAIFAELAEAFGSALVASAEEQRVAAAGQTAAVAAAPRCGARSLDASNSAGLTDAADRAADRIDAWRTS